LNKLEQTIKDAFTKSHDSLQNSGFLAGSVFSYGHQELN